MEASNGRIIFYEPPVYEVARRLRERGYKIADGFGMETSEPYSNVIGILNPREPIQRKFLGFRWHQKQRASYMGNLWFDNERIGAKPDERWVLDVYGRDNVLELITIVGELSKPRGVDLLVKLASEHPRVEVYFSDFRDGFL